MPADVPDVLAHGPGEEGVGIKRERKGGGGGEGGRKENNGSERERSKGKSGERWEVSREESNLEVIKNCMHWIGDL